MSEANKDRYQELIKEPQEISSEEFDEALSSDGEVLIKFFDQAYATKVQIKKISKDQLIQALSGIAHIFGFEANFAPYTTQFQNLMQILQVIEDMDKTLDAPYSVEENEASNEESKNEEEESSKRSFSVEDFDEYTDILLSQAVRVSEKAE